MVQTSPLGSELWLFLLTLGKNFVERCYCRENPIIEENNGVL